MEKILVRVYRYFDQHKTVFWLVFAGSFLALGWWASQVRFEEDISKILPKDKKVDQLQEVFQNSRFADRLVLMVSLKDSTRSPDTLTAYATEEANAIRTSLSPYIARFTEKVDDSLTLPLYYLISDHLPIFLDSTDYAKIDSLTTKEGILKTLQNDYTTLESPTGLALKGMIVHDPVGLSFLGLKKLQNLQYDDNFELYDQYVMTRDRRYLLMFLTPKYPVNNTGMNARLLDGIDAINDSLNKKHPATAATYFGAAAVSVGNALQLRKDTIITQGVVIVFIFVFIGLYFRKKRAPVIILVPVLYGALFALAAVHFVRGSISVIALGAGSVVLGVAVNYSLHVFNHYRHTRSRIQVIRDLAFPLTIGSFTTIGGFFFLEFVQSEMLRDLGLFAAFSLIGASVCSLVFLPHFLPKATNEDIVAEQRRHSWIDRLSSTRPEFNRYLMLGILVLTIVFAWYVPKIGFEADLNRMNYMSPSLKRAEHTLSRISAFSLQSVYVITEGKDLEHALEDNERAMDKIQTLAQQGAVKKYSGVSSLMVSDSLQKLRLARWNNYWTPAKKATVVQTFAETALKIGFSHQLVDSARALLNRNYRPVDRADLEPLRKAYLADYITETPSKSTVVTLIRVPPQGRQKVYDAFDSATNTSVLDRQYLTSKFIDLINNDAGSIAWMTAGLVFAVLLLTYGRLELTIIAFIPMVVTFIWILGIMAILGMQFNIINVIISAFIFGMGDDYSLFIMDGLLQEYKTGKKNLSSFKSSIFLSAITTVAGLGVLIFAGHPALRSIAVISIVGMGCVVILSQIIIPYLYHQLIGRRVARGQFPWTTSGFLKTFFSYTYFAAGAIVLTLIGLILVPLRLKYVFHVIKSAFIRSLIYIMFNVEKKIINPDHENFDKPALVICNHQSFLDSLLIQMLYPRLILLTNRWVWRSPVMGGIVRLADYYPIIHGAEGGVDRLREKVKQGYSIVVFPEGSRSPDGQIRRFHKGAFYLAQELGLDIMPIMIHGSGYTITKGDFLLKDGHITLKFLPRIPQDGTPYKEQAKSIGRYFREEFTQLSIQCEQPPYFRELLSYNYIYKGPVLEWYMRIKTRMEKNYQLFHDLLPREGEILDIGCGYGFMSYMLYFSAPGRRITAFDYDEEKVAVASHCFSASGAVPAAGRPGTPVRWLQADAMSFQFDRKYDGIVLADMLHYLQPKEQKILLERCINNLTKGGVLIIRDGDADLKQRHKGTRYTEFISTKLYGFNKTSSEGLFFFSFQTIRDLAAGMGLECTPIDNTRFTSNVVYVLQHKTHAYETSPYHR